MPVIYRASFGYLTRHPWQLALAILGICIGVAVVVAVDLANQSSRRAFLQSMAAINGAATHQIVGGPNGVDEALYARLRLDGGFRNLAPVVSGYVDVAATTLPVLGVDLFAERGFRQFSSPGDTAAAVTGDAELQSPEMLLRRMLTEAGAAILSMQTANALGLAVDDRFDVQANGRTRSAIVVGIIASTNTPTASMTDLIVTDISTAQSWLDMSGRLSRIDVKVDGGRTTEILDAIRNQLTSDLQLLNAARRTQSTVEMSAAFNTNLTAMSLLALLVGIFLIYNSVSFAVLQRRGLIGVLRALGLTRRQTFALILQESIALGVIGSALGVVLGIWLGEQLLVLVSQSINDLYFRVSVTEVTPDPVSVFKGIAAGIAATAVAAAVPALEASAYQPRLAMLRSTLEQRSSRVLPIIAIAGLVSVAASLFLVALSGSSLVAGLTALFMLIMGIALCIPAGMKLAASTLAAIGSGIGGMPLRLAISGVAASVSRTAVAVVALAVAMSTTVGVGIMVDSFRGSVVAWLDNTLQSDIYVTVASGAMEDALVDDLGALPAVLNTSTARRVWIESPSGRTRLIALQMSPQSYAATKIVEGEVNRAWQQFDDGAVLVSEAYAYRHSLAAGASLTLAARDGPREFMVAGVYQSYDEGQGSVLMSFDTFAGNWDDPGVTSVGLYLRESAAADEVIAAARELSANRQSILIRSNQDIRNISLRVFDQTFIITDVLYWLALGVAVIGILGAMLAVQIERARELATLRALGMTTRQLQTMVITQTGFIGLLSAVAAVPLGIMMAWMLIKVINRRAFGWQMDISISADILIAAVAISVGAATIAGIYPAWRASRSQPALAMRDE